MDALEDLEDVLQDQCKGLEVGDDTVLGTALRGLLVDGVCPRNAPTTTVVAPARPTPSLPTKPTKTTEPNEDEDDDEDEGDTTTTTSSYSSSSSSTSTSTDTVTVVPTFTQSEDPKLPRESSNGDDRDGRGTFPGGVIPGGGGSPFDGAFGTGTSIDPSIGLVISMVVLGVAVGLAWV